MTTEPKINKLAPIAHFTVTFSEKRTRPKIPVKIILVALFKTVTVRVLLDRAKAVVKVFHMIMLEITTKLTQNAFQIKKVASNWTVSILDAILAKTEASEAKQPETIAQNMKIKRDYLKLQFPRILFLMLDCLSNR